MQSSAKKFLSPAVYLKKQLSHHGHWSQCSIGRASTLRSGLLQNGMRSYRLDSCAKYSFSKLRTGLQFVDYLVLKRCSIFMYSLRSKLISGSFYCVKHVSFTPCSSLIALRTCAFTVPVIGLACNFSLVKESFLRELLRCAKCEAEAEVPLISKSDSVVPIVKKRGHREVVLWYSVREFILLNMRAIRLFCVFFPLLLTYPLTYIGPKWFSLWLQLLYVAVERSGATFIKLGQWASTRRDLFSKEVCDHFSHLHHRVRPHAWSHTVKVLREAYGKNWQTLLHLVDNQEPIGSGCIAQVYKGYVSTEFVPTSIMREMEEEINKVYFGEGIEISTLTDSDDDNSAENEDMSDVVITAEDVIPVAIKVMHPKIRETFRRDLKLMKTAAKYLTILFPKLHWVSLNQCVEEFSVTMRKQLDMRYESKCLMKFTHDFAAFDNIRVPQPIPKFVRKNILVETFEEGISVGQIVKDVDQPVELKEELAKIGMDVLLQMVFTNNFVHADLHPGNLLVQNVENFSVQKTAIIQVDALDMMVVHARPVDECPLKLVLLDCGITASLSADDQQKFREVFTAVVKGEGEAVADLFLLKSAVNHCTEPDLFRKEMAQIVAKGRQNLMSISKIRVAELMNDVFEVMSRHKIQLESSFATIILAMAMLEGLGRSLDPNLDLLDKAKPVLLGSIF